MAYNAFDEMNGAAGGDMYLTGGSIFMSEYETEMTPQEQVNYETTLMERLKGTYQRDPYKQDLDFKHWLQTIRADLLEERASKYDDIKRENNGFYKLAGMNPLEGALLEDAGILQQLAHLHTGRIEDLLTIADNLN